jgi:Abi-like protein
VPGLRAIVDALAGDLARNPFTKPASGLEDLAILLAGRGLVFENWADSFSHLEHIGYYRFTGYLHPFKIGGAAEYYLPGTTFELVHDRYIFDRKLRILVREEVNAGTPTPCIRVRPGDGAGRGETGPKASPRPARPALRQALRRPSCGAGP